MSAERTWVNWQDLIVYNDDGKEIGTLGEIVNTDDADTIELDKSGSHIECWPDHLVAVLGDEPNWMVPVSWIVWDGFSAALGREKVG